MGIVINNKTFICHDTCNPSGCFVDTRNNNQILGLYYMCSLEGDNDIYIVYDKQKLNTYRIKNIFSGGIDTTKVNNDQYIDSCTNTNNTTIKLESGEILPKLDLNVIYDPDIISKFPYLPPIYEQDDKHIAYRIDSKYTDPVVGDMITQFSNLRRILLTDITNGTGSDLLINILKDVVCLNVDAIRYTKRMPPVVANLGWMCVYDISIGKNAFCGNHGRIMINRDSNDDWKFISIHELWPIGAITDDKHLDKLCHQDKWFNLFRSHATPAVTKSCVFENVCKSGYTNTVDIVDETIYIKFVGEI